MTMATVRSALVVAALLAGCAAPDPRIVEIPVAAEVPEPPVIERPRLPLEDLTPDAKPDEVMRSYRATVEVLMQYARDLETALDAYRKP